MAPRCSHAQHPPTRALWCDASTLTVIRSARPAKSGTLTSGARWSPLTHPNSPTHLTDDLRALSQSPPALAELEWQRTAAAVPCCASTHTGHTCANTWARAAVATILHSRAAPGSLLNQNSNTCQSSLQPTSDTDHH
ncbi:hypothetical protein SEVIR_8G064750v4 [Setaria viridis]